MRIHTSIFVMATLASTAAAAAPKGKAAKAAAKKHMDRAASASQGGRNEEALKELDAAYALDPQPVLHLARGHLYVKLDRCQEAIKLYEQFLGTNPKVELATMATEAIESCNAKLAPPPAPVEPPPPTVVTSEEINADDENPTLGRGGPVRTPSERQLDAPRTRRWFADPITIGLGVGGVAGIVGGVLLYTSARTKIDGSEAAATYGEWSDDVDDANKLRLYSLVAGTAGALFVTGAVLYVGLKYGGDEDSRVTVTPTQHGGMIGWVGSF
jgi:tetratricopeptide (TPR) repeat protein